MILCDAGPLIALVDKDDREHARCMEAADHLEDEPLLTTLPCMTEAMYFLGKTVGGKGQRALWRLFEDGRVVFQPLQDNEMKRMHQLMIQYSDTPMDFADASLVAVVERLNKRLVFTLDQDFRVYRIHGKHTFDVIP